MAFDDKKISSRGGSPSATPSLPAEQASAKKTRARTAAAASKAAPRRASESLDNDVMRADILADSARDQNVSGLTDSLRSNLSSPRGKSSAHGTGLAPRNQGADLDGAQSLHSSRNSRRYSIDSEYQYNGLGSENGKTPLLADQRTQSAGKIKKPNAAAQSKDVGDPKTDTTKPFDTFRKMFPQWKSTLVKIAAAAAIMGALGFFAALCFANPVVGAFSIILGLSMLAGSGVAGYQLGKIFYKGYKRLENEKPKPEDKNSHVEMDNGTQVNNEKPPVETSSDGFAYQSAEDEKRRLAEAANAEHQEGVFQQNAEKAREQESRRSQERAGTPLSPRGAEAQWTEADGDARVNETRAGLLDTSIDRD